MYLLRFFLTGATVKLNGLSVIQTDLLKSLNIETFHIDNFINLCEKKWDEEFSIKQSYKQLIIRQFKLSPTEFHLFKFAHVHPEDFFQALNEKNDATNKTLRVSNTISTQSGKSATPIQLTYGIKI